MEVIELQELAVARKLTKKNLSEGTLTVSNIGSIGGTYAMILLNVPEAVIVDLDRARGVVQEDTPGSGEIKSRAMSVCWGADDRVVDGATLAGINDLWKSYIDEPSRMMVMLR